jgi:hypothetical protein
VTELTPEELDEARADEAWRLFVEQPGDDPHSRVIAARLAREGWTPPPKVDPDLLAAREWMKANLTWVDPYLIDLGHHDAAASARAFLAGVKHGRGSRPEIVWPDCPHFRPASYATGWIAAVKAIRAQVEGKS